ncbi:MAG TPA: DUF4349 domain-containing protein, partial [Actinoplanes sp.]|nr:DUF4349 domain-containing protein [Actinoplanes sp.]
MGARRWRTTALLSATAMVAGAALLGCSADRSADEPSTFAAPAAQQDRAAPGAGAPDGESETLADEAVDSAAKAPDLSVDQRAIIYTGSITVRVDNVNEAAAKATAIAAGAGGFVGGDKRSSSGDDGPADATLELRVPAARFASVVDQLARLGKEEQRAVGTEDVTEQTLDLDARIATQSARVKSGRALLARAKTLSELVMLEGEVAEREADLASLTAKKRRLADLTALSTITVVLLNPQAAVTDPDDEPAGFLGGLKGGWTALVASLAVLLTVLGALLPWLIAIGLPIWVGVLGYRRYRRRTRAASPAPAASAPAAPAPAVEAPAATPEAPPRG